eukprot:3982506-Amphidinium_carterae.1
MFEKLSLGSCKFEVNSSARQGSLLNDEGHITAPAAVTHVCHSNDCCKKLLFVGASRGHPLKY